ncbi:hypothetical protein [Desulfolithobacter sp.]
MPPPIVLIAGIGLLAFIACFIYALTRSSADHQQQRAVLLETFCNRHGFTFASRVDGNPDLRAKIRCFGGIGMARNPVDQAALRTDPTGRFSLFDQMKISGTSRGGFYTICLAELDRPFAVPELILTEVENRLAAKITRAVGGRRGFAPVLSGESSFDNCFVVFAADPDRTASALNPEVRRLLRAQTELIRARLVVQVQGSRLVVHNSGQGLRTIDTVAELAALFHLTHQLASHWSSRPEWPPGQQYC